MTLRKKHVAGIAAVAVAVVYGLTRLRSNSKDVDDAPDTDYRTPAEN
jgi:hypothetical protein